ncbi:MAG TPA: hypothetical protein VMG60_22570 [Burkholderiaceae bacterium]|nr:hypothetical protein [Burkholderiaceae bacterium]
MRTSSITDADFVGSCTEVATTVTAKLDVTADGGVYVTGSEVVLLKVPQPLPGQPVPESVHVTFGLAAFETAALTCSVASARTTV